MATAEFDLLVVGEINPDLILRGDDVRPAFGQAEKLVEEGTLAVGSSSAIVACGAARLGLSTAFIGLVGDDLFGRFMLDSLRERDIHTAACVVSDEHATGFSVILSQPADRAILTFPGTTTALRYRDIDPAYLERARHLHVSGFFLLDGLRPDLPRLFSEAKEAGMSTSLDTNWDPKGEWSGLSSTLANVDVFLPNEAEALRLTGAGSCEEAARELGRLVETVVVKRGARGGLALSANELVGAPAPDCRPVDTTGAGDSFDAGFLYGYLRGWTVLDSLRLATVCGSLSTRASGGTQAQPTLDEALAILG